MQAYWIVSILVATALSILGLIYVSVFPETVTDYCKIASCDAQFFAVLFAFISAFISTLMYILLLFMYVDLIARVIIYNGSFQVLLKTQHNTTQHKTSKQTHKKHTHTHT